MEKIHDLIDGRFSPNITKYFSSQCPSNKILTLIKQFEGRDRKTVEQEYLKLRLKCLSAVSNPVQLVKRGLPNECDACLLYSYEIYLNIKEPIAPMIQMFRFALAVLGQGSIEEKRYIALLQMHVYEKIKQGVLFLRSMLNRR